jgi:hypothetical protein
LQWQEGGGPHVAATLFGLLALASVVKLGNGASHCIEEEHILYFE